MLILVLFFLISYGMVKDLPSQAGFEDFDAGDAKIQGDHESLTVLEVAKRMFQHPVIFTIALIEFCSGFLRNAIMQWYIVFSKQTGIATTFVPKNWGLLLCCAGIMGGVFAGTISDKFFNSRRGPVSVVLYLIMFVGAVFCAFMLESPYLGWLMVFMSMAIIGVHGMLSGTASMDFSGKKNVGTAVGLIDGMVYLGTGLEGFIYGQMLPKGGDAAKDPNNWHSWPIAMIPVALIGFILALRLWNAHPGKRAAEKNETKIPVTLTAESVSK
jgi:OPA family glycerol-3-phosphate transporter-like MFS transporter